MSGESNAAEQEDQSDEMRVDPARAKELVENLSRVTARISSAAQGRPVRLLAVSKLKPASDILALHQSSGSGGGGGGGSNNPTAHLHFGENYAQELAHKASVLPRSIRWHFIGGLQSNKCKDLARIPNLWSVESVDSVKKADALEKGRRAWQDSSAAATAGADTTGTQAEEEEDGGSAAAKSEEKESSSSSSLLGIHIQINTSGEDTKSGVSPTDAASLCRHVLEHCPHLHLRGLMTIGAIARSSPNPNPNNPNPNTQPPPSTSVKTAADPNPDANEDFIRLKQTRDRIYSELSSGSSAGTSASAGAGGAVDLDLDLELSMGMSNDFEEAIRLGSAEVRVGSQIFGERPAKGGGGGGGA
ncbi:MAG: hypothetical protein M1837_003657 [Sclerophora amabilis]|nr:MAG: hypothetical protein M1837_003657 [Sclerophora amabilis]